MRFGRVLEIKKSPEYYIYHGFTIFHAKKDGRLFLRDEKTTWNDINGFMARSKRVTVIVVFKRFGW